MANMPKTLFSIIILASTVTLLGMNRPSKMSRELKGLLQQASQAANQSRPTAKPTIDLINLLQKQFETEKHDPSQQQRTAIALARAYALNKDLDGRIRWLTTAFNLDSKYAAQELTKYYADKNKKVAQVFALFDSILATKESGLMTIMPGLQIYYPEFKNEVNQAIGLNDKARLDKALDTLEAIIEKESLPDYGNDMLSTIEKLRTLNQ